MRRLVVSPVLLVLLAIVVVACRGGADDGTRTGEASTDPSALDASALAESYLAEVQAVVAQQESAGVALTPLGRLLENCLAIDDAALAAIAEGLGIGGQTGEVLNATLQQPDGPEPTLSCAIRFGEASAGAVVLSAGATEDSAADVRTQLVAADYEEIPDAAVEGLPDEEVLLFDATTFEATRAVWLGQGFQISLTANADLADSGALLAALPTAVAEVFRVLG